MKAVLRVASAQCDIVWENKVENFQTIDRLVRKASESNVDLIVFPEMMTTGFTSDFQKVKEEEGGETELFLKNLSTQYGIAIVTTYVCCVDGKYFNRALFVKPSGEIEHQDKRHLFRMGGEAEKITPAHERHIISYGGWNFFISICYDLRFPVWCRNVDKEYDVLIATANWPEPRSKVWKILQTARALENLCYVIGSNRIGKDFSGLNHIGDSYLISPRGEFVDESVKNTECLLIGDFHKEPLEKLRTKFPVWMDQDKFNIEF